MVLVYIYYFYFLFGGLGFSEWGQIYKSIQFSLILFYFYFTNYTSSLQFYHTFSLKITVQNIFILIRTEECNFKWLHVIKWHVRFTTLPLKTFSNEECMRSSLLELIIFNPGFFLKGLLHISPADAIWQILSELNNFQERKMPRFSTLLIRKGFERHPCDSVIPLRKVK